MEQDQDNTLHQPDEEDLYRRAKLAVHETYVDEAAVIDNWPKDPERFLTFLIDFIRLPIEEYQHASTMEEVHSLSKSAAVGIEAYLNEFGGRVVADREMGNI